MKIEPASKTFSNFKDYYNKDSKKEANERLSKKKIKNKIAVDCPTKIKEGDNIVGWA